MKSQSNMKLTSEQIDRLYQFTIKHFVEYYDLQTELVDHLANAIEQQWQENPNVTFEDALQTVFKKFGDSGFRKLLVQRKKALRIKSLKLIWSHFKTFFKIPRIILTFLAVFFVFYILKNNDFTKDSMLFSFCNNRLYICAYIELIFYI